MTTGRFPAYGWAGVALVAAGQALTLVHWRPLSDYWYSLCWYGVALAADAFLARRHRSLLTARPREAVLMLLVSATAWWALEWANAGGIGAWSYSPSDDVPRWLQRARSTVAFASLVPVTFELAMVALALRPLARLRLRRGIVVGPKLRATAMAAGAAALAAAAVFPSLGLALILSGVVALLDPWSHRRGRPSLLGCVERGDLRLPAALVMSSLAWGLVGEAWNYPADPKWTYHVPYVDFAHVFEMPLLGYLGYPVFAFAVFAVYHAVRGTLEAAPAAREGDDPLSLVGL
jgi:hypothetical protein